MEFEKRQTLDQLGPHGGMRIRVFFPYGVGPRVMVASGETRPASSRRCESEHRMSGLGATAADVPEWVPGWYVTQKV